MKLIGTNTVELHLPHSMRIHPVIDISHVKPYHDHLPGQPMSAPGPSIVMEDCDEEYEVEYMVDSRYKGKCLEYLIHWKGWSKTDCTWEPLSNLGNAADVVHNFHASHPSALCCLHGSPPSISCSYSTMSGHHLPSLHSHRLIAWKSILRRGAVLHMLRLPWYSFSFSFSRHSLPLFS